MSMQTVIAYIEFGFACVGLVYGLLTSVANKFPASKVGLFCARWAGTVKHTIEVKAEVEAAVKQAAELKLPKA